MSIRERLSKRFVLLPKSMFLQELTKDLRYHFDTLFARGPVAFIGFLFLCTALLDLAVTELILLFGWLPMDQANDGYYGNFWELSWQTMTRLLDPGTFAGDHGFAYRLAMLVATLGGIILVSAIVAILTNALDSWMQRLRRGRSVIREKNHTVILGWSPYITDIIDQLIAAHAIAQQEHASIRSRIKPKMPCITILADMDKAEMEDYLREHVKDMKKAKIRCRRGSPIDAISLEIVNYLEAKSIIVLRSETKYADVELVKILLTMERARTKKQKNEHTKAPSIVAEIADTENVVLLEMVAANPQVELVQVSTFVSRLIAQTSLQPGLATVYNNLFDFNGNDILFVEQNHVHPQSHVHTYADAVLCCENGIVIGIESSDGTIRLNPPRDTRIAVSDVFIMIAQDEHTLVRDLQAKSLRVDRVPIDARTQQRQIHTLCIGWNWRSKKVIQELDTFSLPGSQITVLAEDHEGGGVSFLKQLEALDLTNLVVHAHVCETTNRKALRSHMADFDHVIIMAYTDLPDAQQADAITIMTLSHMRYFLKDARQRYNIVTEIIDARNRELIASEDVDDFVVSDKVVSMYLAQIAHQPKLNAVYTELLTANGNEIYLKPITDYVVSPQNVTFRTLVSAALARNEIAIGYRRGNVGIGEDDVNKLVINPGHHDVPLPLSTTDRLIVISERE